MNVKLMNTNSITEVLAEKKEESKNNVVLETKNLKISYSGVMAVKGISFSIPKNEITAIIGPSGCGKSTL
ncbi:MAG: ATP-binding cassette domain-containing protein, partial [Nitrospinota bacterium]|nr:ATP-binding cassette domain-containing protein [Nitrospinota bacterium]